MTGPNRKIRTVESIAAELTEVALDSTSEDLLWIGLAGAPGSGKSTLARHLRERLGDLLVVIPMDGYHYSRRELDEMDQPEQAHARRGAPFTFDAHRFVADLVNARSSGQGSFPDFDHGAGDPIENAVQLLPDPTRIVLVEGNYLLLDDQPWSRLRAEVFDETWFLDVPVAVCRERVRQRHIATGKAPAEAMTRVLTNDGPNAELVNRVSPKNADHILTAKTDHINDA